MDFQRLYDLIPKEPRRWNQKDVDTWLHYIGMQNLSPIFNSNSIDGSCIEVLVEQDLIDLGIEPNLKRKKMMQWIQIGLPEFNRFVRGRNGPNDWSIISTANQEPISHRVTPVEEQLVYQPAYNDYSPAKGLQHLQQNNHEEEFGFKQELVESQSVIEAPVVGSKHHQSSMQMAATVYINPQPAPIDNTAFTIRDESSGRTIVIRDKPFKFGRAPDNDLVLTEDFVSRVHCQIIKKQDKFFIQDLGSTSGTFVSLNNPTLLKTGLILHMGSQQIQINSINVGRGECSVVAVMIDGQEVGKELKFKLKQNQDTLLVGRTLELFRNDSVQF